MIGKVRLCRQSGDEEASRRQIGARCLRILSCIYDQLLPRHLVTALLKWGVRCRLEC